jgi:hypothetical protein
MHKCSAHTLSPYRGRCVHLCTSAAHLCTCGVLHMTETHRERELMHFRLLTSEPVRTHRRQTR